MARSKGRQSNRWLTVRVELQCVADGFRPATSARRIIVSNRVYDYDLIITAGRVYCRAANLDGPGYVAVREGCIVAAGAGVHGPAAHTLDFPDGVLLPGLIDLHAHPARSGSVFGVDPDTHMLTRGVTTVLSQGDAGADNLHDYIEQTIRESATRVRLAINLSRIGESTDGGCFAKLSDADVDACVAAVLRHRADVWGIAVNASHHACGGSDPREILRRGLAVADQTGLPVLYGMRRTSDVSFQEQLAPLRAGDVVTYCFRREPHCIIERGRVHAAIRAARERGILFDVGHGMASFDFEVAETALRDGFPPDTISTDLQRRHLGRTPRHDLPLVMSKLRGAGMPEADVFAAVTTTPSRALRLDDQIGALAPGKCADLTVLRWFNDPVTLEDTSGASRKAGRWTAQAVIRAGHVLSARTAQG